MKLPTLFLTIFALLGAYLGWQYQAQPDEVVIPLPQISITYLPFAPVTVSPEALPADVTQPQAPTEPAQPIPIETAPANCATQDSQGLASAFERELGIFLNNAAATYGSQYSNLQYSISNQQISQNGSQGTVSANYQGSVSEISTGETISASGGMSVNFSWDGCLWQLVDYSYF